MKCDKCGKEMIVKINSKNNQKFWACYGFPACKNTKPLEDTGKAENAQPQPSNAQIGVTKGISKVEHEFKNCTEFGPAGNRHKVYWKTIQELKDMIQALGDEGLIIEKI